VGQPRGLGRADGPVCQKENRSTTLSHSPNTLQLWLVSGRSYDVHGKRRRTPLQAALCASGHRGSQPPRADGTVCRVGMCPRCRDCRSERRRRRAPQRRGLRTTTPVANETCFYSNGDHKVGRQSAVLRNLSIDGREEPVERHRMTKSARGRGEGRGAAARVAMQSGGHECAKRWT